MLHVAALKPTTLKSSLSASATSVILASLEDRHGNTVSLSTFGEWGTIVVKSGDQWECIKFDALVNNADGSVTLTVATNGRKILPVTPFTGGSTGFDFIAGSDVIVTSDGLIMSTFGNVENTQTWNEQQTFPGDNTNRPILTSDVNASDDKQLITKGELGRTTTAGAPDASTTAKGIVEVQTQAEYEAGTSTGGTSAPLVHPANIGARFFAGYAADAGANDTYAITLSPVPSAYQTGMVIAFKANTANTGACTLNVNTLGAKSLKVNGLDPRDNYIKAASIVLVVYDGTNMEILSVSGQPQVSQDGNEIYAADAGVNDTYVITLTPAPAAYVTGMVLRFKANTVNTGTATVNVNSLGAKTIVRPDSTTLMDGDIAASQIVQVVYDGTNFVLLSPTARTPVGINASGTTSKDASDASTTQTIAHGLGKIPKFVRLTLMCVASNGTTPLYAMATYNGTTQSSISFYEVTGPAFAHNASEFRLNASATSGTTIGTVTFDATNISIAWVKTGSPTGNYSFHWEALA